MWDSLWLAGNIATMSQKKTGYGLIKNGYLAIKNGHIAETGKISSLPQNYTQKAKKLVDFRPFLITPGLVDCHTHMVYAQNRAHEFSLKLNGSTYEEIAQQGGGIASSVKQLQKASHQELFAESLTRVKQAIRKGTTTLEIKSGYGLTLPNELKQLKVIKELQKKLPIDIYSTYLCAHSFPKNFHSKDSYVQNIITKFFPAVHKENLADFIDVFCEKIAFNNKQCEEIFKAAQKYSWKIKIHAEQLSNSKGALLAAKYSAVSADHLEYASKKDVEALKKAGCTPVLLPGAYYFLRETKKPPIELFRKHKLNFAIATDCNPGTSPALSLPLMMNMAAVFWGVTPKEALQGTTIFAAEALGIEQKCGSLEVGKMADLVLWPFKHPDEISYHIAAEPDLVIKNGQTI